MARPPSSSAGPVRGAGEAAGAGHGPGGAGGARRAPRTPQQARSRRTRERVLEAAVACFEERGYDATTTAAIASRAGVAVGTLYAYFTDKRSILLELMDATVRRIADHVVQGLEPADWREGDPRAQVAALIDAIFHARDFEPGMQRILWERYFKDPEFRAAVQEVEGRVRGALERLFEALRAEGRLRIEDPHVAAFVIYTAVEWMAARLLLGEADADPDAAARAATDMIARFLFPS